MITNETIKTYKKNGAGQSFGLAPLWPKSDQTGLLINRPFYRAKYDRAVERYWQARTHKAEGETPLPVSGLNPEGIRQPIDRRTSSTAQSEQPKKADKTLFDKKEAI